MEVGDTMISNGEFKFDFDKKIKIYITLLYII